MERKNDKSVYKKNGVAKLSSEIPLSWHVNITKIDLSLKGIEIFSDEIKFPDNLIHLNLSHNRLTNIPVIISKLEKLKSLDVSYNEIKHFDETPKFCHTLEQLDLTANKLIGPPHWIWTEKPKQLFRLNLSCNPNITDSVQDYLEELMQYNTLVTEVDLHNCGLRNAHFLKSFPNAKTIILGSSSFSYPGANEIGSVPCKGLENCCSIENLNLSNTHMHTINCSIDMFKNLRDLNLALNNLYGLPNEFCNLNNLETCVLSYNKLVYLPSNMHKLEKLQRLYLDSNELCMMPERLNELPNLKTLDLYDNQLCEIADDFSHLDELDVAQNYLDEPDGVDYIEMKEKLRLLHAHRSDGRKPEMVLSETGHSSAESDDDVEYYTAVYNGDVPAEEWCKPENERASSPEDWDSDDHWVPHDVIFNTPSEPWVQFIQQKMRDGNFCPIDAHVVSITEQVMYHKRLYPQVDVEIIGQFDDYSGDDT